MLRKTVLPLALVIALIAVAGVAVATTGSGGDATMSSDTVVTTVPTTIADDGESESSEVTATAGEVEETDRSITPAAPTDSDDNAGVENDYDDGYVGDDDESAEDHDDYTDTDDDDDEYYDDDDEYYDDGYEIADGVYPIDVSPYGSITVEVTGGMLYLVSVDVDSVWMLHKRDEKSDEVELGFYWGESELKIKVEIDDGQLKKMVEFDMK